MSQENVELVRAAFRGWNAAGVDGMRPFLHEDFEYLPNEEGASVQGHDALRRYFERWMEPWDEYEMGPTEFLSRGACVLIGVALKARGRGSGIAVAMNFWQVWRVRDGRAARCEEYMDRTEALRAASLSE